MKRAVLPIIVLFLIACQSEEKPQPLSQPTDNKIIKEKPRVETPTEKSVHTVIPLDKEKSTSPIIEEVLLPAVNDDFLPEDPFLRLIELKIRYYRDNKLKDSPFENNTVTAINKLNNSYFVGTLRGGVFHYHQNGSLKKSIIKPSNSIVNRSVTGIVANSNIYISTYAGIFRYDMENDNLETLTVDNGDRSILALTNHGEKIYWGTAGGNIYCLEKSQVHKVLQINSPINVIQNFDDILFIGTNDGKLYSYQDHQISELINLNSFERGGVKINDFLFHQNRILILTTQGLWVLDRNLALLDRFYKEQVFLDSVMSENYIYMGTHSGGVIIYDKINDKYSVWGLDMGIPSLNIPSVEVVGEELLLSIPDKGIVIINEEIHEKL